MKATELIAELQKIVDEHGDLPVKTYKNHPIDGIYDGNYEIVSVKHFVCPFKIGKECIELETEEFA